MIRLIGSIFISGKKAHQTINFNKFRPLGSVRNVLKIYDQHQVDEIFLSRKVTGALNFTTDTILKDISNLRISTPLVYSGGIRSTDDVKVCLNSGIERVAVNSMLFDTNKLNEIIKFIGSQGVIAVIPFLSINDAYYAFNTCTNKSNLKVSNLINQLDKHIEILLIDMNSDGTNCGFNWDIFMNLPRRNYLIQGSAFSDIKDRSFYRRKNIKGISIENILLWKETVVYKFKSDNDIFRDIE